MPGVGDVLPGAGGGGVRTRRAGGGSADLQDPPSGRQVLAGRFLARPGVGAACRGGGACRGARGARAGGERAHRAWTLRCRAGAISWADGDHRAHGGAGLRGVPAARRPVRAGGAGHDDDLHRLLRRAGSVSRVCSAVGTRARAGRQGAARQRLPQHPLPVRVADRRAGPAGARRGVAARGVLGEPGGAVRRSVTRTGGQGDRPGRGGRRPAGAAALGCDGRPGRSCPRSRPGR